MRGRRRGIGRWSVIPLGAAAPLGFCAAVALNDVDAAVAELDRAVHQLGAVDVHLHPRRRTPAGRGAVQAVLVPRGRTRPAGPGPPCRSSSWADYPAEERSRYEIWWTSGWEYDLSAFMARIVFGGALERHPDLKLLIHHGGSVIPHFSGRVGPGWDQLGSRTPDHQRKDVTGYPLTRRPLDCFKMCYADTALFGAPYALRCALEFFGPERVLFGNAPSYDPGKGPGYIRSGMADVLAMELTEEQRAAVFAGNVRRPLGARLPA